MKIKNLKDFIKLYDTERYLFDIVGPKAKKRGYLTFDEFYQICMWKSARQKQKYISKNNQKIIENISGRVFKEKGEEKKMKLLCEKLSGVWISTASAILTVIFPEKYAVIDIRCLEILREKFNQKINRGISYKTWLNYLALMRDWAKENNITPRELDMAFFAMHRKNLNRQNFKNLYAK